MKARGGDANNRVRLFVENNSRTDRRRASSETPLPKPMADDRHRRRTRRVFFRPKRASSEKRNAEQGKQVVRDLAPIHILGVAGLTQRSSVIVPGRYFKNPALALAIDKVRLREV